MRLLLAAAAALVSGAASAAPARVVSTSVSYSDPAWSPQGARIAFVARETVIDGATSTNSAWLETMTADGRNVRKVASLRSDRIGWPSWSPDGRKIAFGYDQLYVVGADGAGLRRLRNGACCAAWGPGGRKIAFSD